MCGVQATANMYVVRVRRTCTSYLYHSVNTLLGSGGQFGSKLIAAAAITDHVMSSGKYVMSHWTLAELAFDSLNTVQLQPVLKPHLQRRHIRSQLHENYT